MKFREGWSSHLAVLDKVLNELKRIEKAKGISPLPALEMGMGLFSTPFLHWMCNDQGRRLVSFDNEKEYFKMNCTFRSPNHEITLVEDWNKADIDNNNWGLAFIDHAPARRRIDDAKRIKKSALFVVCHDTQPQDDRFYKYHWLWDKFKYVYHYTKASPNTSVLSNFIDLSFLNEGTNL